MKGKRLNQEFIGRYISNCISNNITLSDDMVSCARQRVDEIDQKIKEVELLKQERGNLLDVIESFQKTEKPNNNKEIKLLSLYKIANLGLCKLICENVDRFEIKEIRGYSKLDVLSCVKQLIEHKIIARKGSGLVRGDLFNEYCSFVLKMDII